MARTPAQAKSLEAKAQAAASKSEGLRMLLDAGYTVAEARTALNVPYGFAYGVAKRHGVIESAANRRAPVKAKAAKSTAKAAPRAAKKSTAKRASAKRAKAKA